MDHRLSLLGPSQSSRDGFEYRRSRPPRRWPSVEESLLRRRPRSGTGQRILMMVCLKILPVWILLLLVAFGALRLPFNIPFVDDLLS